MIFKPKTPEEIVSVLNETYEDFDAITIDDALLKLRERKIKSVYEQKFEEACKYRDLEKILLNRVESFKKIENLK